MRIQTNICLVLLSHIMALGCSAAPSLTNQLALLLTTTNKPGQYRLEPAWVGESEETVATGFFAKRSYTPAQERSERELRFDLFSYFDKPLTIRMGSKVISKSHEKTEHGWSQSSLHSHRASFPTDAELTEARTMAALTNLLGSSQGFTDGWGDGRAMHSTARWSFFRFGDDTTLETLSIFCFITRTNGQPETYVDSIRIRRGTARPAR